MDEPEALPSRSQVENLYTSFLRDAAEYWDGLADKIEKPFTDLAEQITKPGGTVWEGPAGDAAQSYANRAGGTAGAGVTKLREAAKTARLSEECLHAAKDRIIDAVIDIEADGFAVGQNWWATDTRSYPYDQLVTPEQNMRAAKAKEHSEYLRYRVARLLNAAKDDAGRLLEITQGLDTLEFPGMGAPSTDGHIQAVDDHWKQGGPNDAGASEDPKRFHDFWQGLTPQQKDQLYDREHDIGNQAGMPFVDKDHYNRLHLGELERKTQADVDRMQHAVDEMMRGHNVDDGALYALQTQLAASRNHLEGYKVLEAELNSTNGPKRYLGQIDEFGHGAVSIGNPDTAKRNAILVPGTGQDLPNIGASDNKAVAMYQAALDANRSLRPEDVAVTTWMGYDRPMGLSNAEFADLAHRGAANLDAFENGMRASHVGAPSTDTVIGHSYGSTLVGAAASGGHHLDANNVIAVGSPGMLVDWAGALDLDPDAHVYSMRADNDVIGPARVATTWTLGADPADAKFGATRLYADPGPSWHGLPSVDAHSSYWKPGPGLKNLGAVIAGVPPPFVIGQR